MKKKFQKIEDLRILEQKNANAIQSFFGGSEVTWHEDHIHVTKKLHLAKEVADKIEPSLPKNWKLELQLDTSWNKKPLFCEIPVRYEIQQIPDPVVEFRAKWKKALREGAIVRCHNLKVLYLVIENTSKVGDVLTSEALSLFQMRDGTVIKGMSSIESRLEKQRAIDKGKRFLGKLADYHGNLPLVRKWEIRNRILPVEHLFGSLRVKNLESFQDTEIPYSSLRKGLFCVDTNEFLS